MWFYLIELVEFLMKDYLMEIFIFLFNKLYCLGCILKYNKIIIIKNCLYLLFGIWIKILIEIKLFRGYCCVCGCNNIWCGDVLNEMFWCLGGLLCIWIVDGRKCLGLGIYFKLEIEWVCFIYVLCGEIGCN